MIVIFDIDGTIADVKHRRKFLEQEKPDWKSFNNKMANDTPNLPIVELYKTLWFSNNYDLILVTGRNERFREITEKWLSLNDIPFRDIMMRPDDDYREDKIIKEEFLKKLISEGKEILFVVDDRASVVNMWRENGITCLQCDKGYF